MSSPGAAAERAAVGSAGDAAVSSSQAPAHIWLNAEASLRKGMGPLAGGAELLAEGVPPAAAASRSFSEVVRQWPAAMRTHEPVPDARDVAEARVKVLAEAAKARASATSARGCALPSMPRHPVDRAQVSFNLANVMATADNMAMEGLQRMLKELVSLQRSSVTLVDTAHAHGLAVISRGVGPGLLWGRLWAAASVEASASAHGAHVQAHATVLPVDSPEPELLEKRRGGRHAPRPDLFAQP